MRKRSTLTMLLLVVIAMTFGIFSSSNAGAVVSEEKCYEQVTEYQYERVIPGTPDEWYNFSPNKDQGSFEGPPTWPTDERGTWNHIDKPIPPGQQGPDGVYQNGNGNGSWFYRKAGTPDTVETSDWLQSPPPGDGWVQIGERTVDGEEIPCPPTTTTTEVPVTTTVPSTTTETTVPETTVPETTVPETVVPQTSSTAVGAPVPVTELALTGPRTVLSTILLAVGAGMILAGFALLYAGRRRA